MSRATTTKSSWRAAAALAGGALIVPALVWTGASPASAAVVNATIDDIVYEADDADVAAGAVVDGYVGSGGAVVVPDSVTIAGTEYDVVRIGNSAFDGENITSVSLGANVRTVGMWAFEDNAITSVSLPAGLELIDSYGFAMNQLTEVDIPAGTEVGYQAFAENQLTSLTLPEGFDFPEGPTAQFSDNQISSLTLPDSVTLLPHYVFRDNSLTDVVIPASVVEIREQAFNGNPLATVTFLGDAPELTRTGSTGAWIPGAEVFYPCAYDEANGGGFTSPVWDDGEEDHDSSALPVTVTFDTVHGDPIVEMVVCNDPIVAPADPTADGYEFVGWTISGDTFSFENLTARVDVTIVAEWEPVEGTTDTDADADADADNDAAPTDGSDASGTTDGTASAGTSTGGGALASTGLSPSVTLAAALSLLLLLLGGAALVATRRA